METAHGWAGAGALRTLSQGDVEISYIAFWFIILAASRFASTAKIGSPEAFGCAHGK